MLTEIITFRKNVSQTGSTFNRNTVTITSRCHSPQAVTLDKSNLKKTDDDQYSWVKERIRKIPYLQYHAIRESNPRQMRHETLISYSIRSFWIILIEGISSCESLYNHDHEFNDMLPGVMKIIEYDEIEKYDVEDQHFVKLLIWHFLKYTINVNGYCWNLENQQNTSDKE